MARNVARSSRCGRGSPLFHIRIVSAADMKFLPLRAAKTVRRSSNLLVNVLRSHPQSLRWCRCVTPGVGENLDVGKNKAVFFLVVFRAAPFLRGETRGRPAKEDLRVSRWGNATEQARLLEECETQLDAVGKTVGNRKGDTLAVVLPPSCFYPSGLYRLAKEGLSSLRSTKWRSGRLCLMDGFSSCRSDRALAGRKHE